MSDPLFLGIDVGTQSTKALLVDVAARGVIARASRAHGLIEGLPPGAAEQHPDTWMEAVALAIDDLEQDHPGEFERVAAIGVSGQQHGFVPLDENERVIRPAKLWCDTSTAAEARELSSRLGRHVPVGYTASKILWLARHEPSSFARLRHVLLPHDYVNLRLTGRRTMEAGDASGTGFFDPVRREFDVDAMAAIDPSLASMLPRLVEPGQLAGTLLELVARRLHLRPGIAVSCGGGDNMMSAIGAGATRDGVVVVSLGTSGTVFARSARPIVDPEGLIAPFCDSTGGYLPLLCVMNATGVTEEVRAAFSGQQGLDHAALTSEAERVPAGCHGVMWLPFLNGERVPDLPDATGALLGLRPGLLRAGVLYRAAIEGVALNLGAGVERMRKLGIAVSSVRLVGGASKNPLWQRIIAAVLNVPVVALDEPESAALGAALQACFAWRRARGDEVTIDAIANEFVVPSQAPLQPDPADVLIYRDLAQRFHREVGRTYGA